MKICFPSTNRVYLSRQQLLLKELKKHFQVDIIEYRSAYDNILNVTADIANHFRKVLGGNNYDLILIRGDRFEQLPIALLASYKRLKIAHLEAGDISGAIDNKVRHAITALSDIHFATNKESYARLIAMGTDPDWTFNFGSLDVEYAKEISRIEGEIAKINFTNLENLPQDYVLICHHALAGENPALIEKIVREEFKGNVIVIKSNKDNGAPYGKEEYSSEDYINLIAGAKCLVGNSSSFLKEASIFGTPVVNIGSRQQNRLKPHNVKDVPFEENQIRQMLRFQLQTRYEPSDIYWQEGTSIKITEKIKEFLE